MSTVAGNAAFRAASIDDGNLRFCHPFAQGELPIDGAVLAERARSTTNATGTPVCSSIEISGVCFVGPIELTDGGNEQTPLARLIFNNCTFDHCLNLSGSYIRGFEMTDCRLIHRDRCLAANHSSFGGSFRIKNTTLALESSLDFSQTRFLDDCSLINLFSDNGGVRAGFSHISFTSADIARDLTFSGVCVDITSRGGDARGYSLDAESVHVGGDLAFTWEDGLHCGDPHPCSFVGGLNLFAAVIDGQVQLKGIKIEALNEARKFGLALAGREMKIGGDLYFLSYHKSPTPEAGRVLIRGEVLLESATVGGETLICGRFESKARQRSIAAANAQFGDRLLIGNESGTDPCYTDAELDFTMVEVSGDMRVNASILKVRVEKREEARKNNQSRCNESAVNLRRAHIKGDLRFMGTSPAEHILEGIDLIGANVEGKLDIRGITIRCNRAVLSGAAHPGAGPGDRFEKALRAHGAVIAGGIRIKPYTDPTTLLEHQTVIEGDVRMRNAVVHGAFVMQGVRFDSDVTEGVALWASNSSFEDVFIEPSKRGMASKINGELRFRGTQISGVLRLKGVELKSAKSGLAIDCFMAEISRGISICNAGLDDTPVFASLHLPTIIEGIVRLDSVTTALLEIGQEHGRADSTAGPSVHIRGALLLREAKVQLRVSFNNVRFDPIQSITESDVRRESAYSRLGKLSIGAAACIVSARFAKLGLQFGVLLNADSSGFVDLFEAETVTLCSPDGNHADDWARQPTELALRKALYTSSFDGVALNLDGFLYQRLVNQSPRRLSSVWIDMRRFLLGAKRAGLLDMLQGRATEDLFGERLTWLRRQIPLIDRTFVAQPYRHLALVYREQGEIGRSNRLVWERRYRQLERPGDTRFPSLNVARSWIRPERLFGLFFGFGYSQFRALFTIMLLYISSSVFIHRSFQPLAGHSAGIHQEQFNPRSEKWEDVPLGAAPTTQNQTAAGQPSVTWCKGQLCTSIGTLANDSYTRCDLSRPKVEALKLILPFTRFQDQQTCVLRADSPRRFIIGRMFIELLSWIIFALAALTFTGVLQEKG